MSKNYPFKSAGEDPEKPSLESLEFFLKITLESEEPTERTLQLLEFARHFAKHGNEGVIFFNKSIIDHYDVLITKSENVLRGYGDVESEASAEAYDLDRDLKKTRHTLARNLAEIKGMIPAIELSSEIQEDINCIIDQSACDSAIILHRSFSSDGEFNENSTYKVVNYISIDAKPDDTIVFFEDDLVQLLDAVREANKQTEGSFTL